MQPLPPRGDIAEIVGVLFRELQGERLVGEGGRTRIASIIDSYLAPDCLRGARLPAWRLPHPIHGHPPPDEPGRVEAFASSAAILALSHSIWRARVTISSFLVRIFIQNTAPVAGKALSPREQQATGKGGIEADGPQELPGDLGRCGLPTCGYDTGAESSAESSGAMSEARVRGAAGHLRVTLRLPFLERCDRGALRFREAFEIAKMLLKIGRGLVVGARDRKVAHMPVGVAFAPIGGCTIPHFPIGRVAAVGDLGEVEHLQRIVVVNYVIVVDLRDRLRLGDRRHQALLDSCRWLRDAAHWHRHPRLRVAPRSSPRPPARSPPRPTSRDSIEATSIRCPSAASRAASLRCGLVAFIADGSAMNFEMQRSSIATAW